MMLSKISVVLSVAVAVVVSVLCASPVHASPAAPHLSQLIKQDAERCSVSLCEIDGSPKCCPGLVCSRFGQCNAQSPIVCETNSPRTTCNIRRRRDLSRRFNEARASALDAGIVCSTGFCQSDSECCDGFTCTGTTCERQPDQNPDDNIDQTPEQTPDQTSDQTPDQNTNQDPDQNTDQVPDRCSVSLCQLDGSPQCCPGLTCSPFGQCNAESPIVCQSRNPRTSCNRRRRRDLSRRFNEARASALDAGIVCSTGFCESDSECCDGFMCLDNTCIR